MARRKAGRKPSRREVGDKYRPVATVIKMKKGTPTVLEVSGNRYVLISPDGYPGPNKKGANNK